MRLSILIIGFALLTAACGGARTTPSPVSSAEPLAFHGSALDAPIDAPGFSLRDQAGRTIDLHAQRGRIALVTFLYTHCPDVCPLIAANLNQALRQLGPSRNQVRVLAVSVDPQGDTKRAVRSFIRAHHLLPEFRYLTGSRAELMPIWQAWHVSAVARDPDLVDHTAYTALLDREGRERVTYDARVRAKDVAHDVNLLLKEGNG